MKQGLTCSVVCGAESEPGLWVQFQQLAELLHILRGVTWAHHHHVTASKPGGQQHSWRWRQTNEAYCFYLNTETQGRIQSRFCSKQGVSGQKNHAGLKSNLQGIKVTYSMLDPVTSNSMCLTSWKCDGSVTLLLNTILAGNGWDWEGTVWSMGILSWTSSFSCMSSRKWNV